MKKYNSKCLIGLILVLTIIFVGFKRQTPDDYTIIFGQTGGFTNINPIFKLNNSGELWRKANQDADFEFLKNVDDQKLAQINNLLNQINFDTLTIHDVGNVTYFIEFKSTQTSKKITWTDDTALSPPVEGLYKQLLSNLKN